MTGTVARIQSAPSFSLAVAGPLLVTFVGAMASVRCTRTFSAKRLPCVCCPYASSYAVTHGDDTNLHSTIRLIVALAALFVTTMLLLKTETARLKASIMSAVRL